jgi:glycerophosphoryl diester phosphodiesterase
MWSRVRAVAGGAFDDLSQSWRTLAITDLAFKAAAFAVLTPASALLLRWLLSRAGTRAVADADIARLLIASPVGLIALLVTAIITTAVTILELACLMEIAVAAEEGTRINARSALAFGLRHTSDVVRLAFHMVIRVIAAVLPFLAAIGIVYLLLLRDHDINYYLARKPPAFLAAVVLVGIIALALAALIARTIASWALSLPLVIFENVNPRQALRASADASKGHRVLILSALGLWLAIALVVGAISATIVETFARLIGPHTASSVPTLVFFLTVLVILWIASVVVVTVFNASMLALFIVRLWRGSRPVTPPQRTREPVTALPAPLKWAAIAGVFLFAAGFAMLAFLVTRRDERILILAHRGASIEQPENTLAAFRVAVAQKADYIELDVQESSDGQVLIVHDSDLMKIGGSPMKIWEHTAAELRTVDIGKGEHVPTLAEALETCRGTLTHVMVELKSYGHGQHLEERTAQVVEAAGMTNACAYMSLDHDIVRTMKRLRPSWRTGALVAKAVGDPTAFDGDFLAVEAHMLTPSLVRRAHRVGKDVYVWTVDDPASMLAAASRGSDGVITNYPAVARDVLQRRASMSDGERLLVAILIRAGVRNDGLQAEETLRP